MSEINQQIMDAMFTQQRLQVLSLGKHHGEFSDAYLYAWARGVYPLFEDSDGSIPQRPHEHYGEYFRTSAEKVEELTDYLFDCRDRNEIPTFYELEDRFRVSIPSSGWTRGDLLKICRYMYLNTELNKSFWNHILTPLKHPSEAGGIIGRFNREQDIDFGW